VDPALIRAVAAALLLAGCSGPASPAPGMGLEAVPGDAARLLLAGCSGATATVRSPHPLPATGVPAGWEGDGNPLHSVRVTVLECVRVSWGPFERGPVSLVMEWRDDLQPPPACMANVGTHLVLASIGFSDPELATYAKGTAGMPAGLAAFASQEVPVGPVAQREWRWGPPGAAPSLLAVPAAGDFPFWDEQLHRLHWADGDGVSRLDLRYNYTTGSVDPKGAWGELRPPMLYGQANPVAAFASTSAGRLEGLEAQGTVERFGDPQCGPPR